MEGIIESSQAESLPQDKKNYATTSAEKNNCDTNSITIADEKQRRISAIANFFNQLYGKIPEPHLMGLETCRESYGRPAPSIANSA